MGFNTSNFIKNKHNIDSRVEISLFTQIYKKIKIGVRDDRKKH